MNLQDKVALVTGGGTGLGLAISTALAARGCAVAVNYSRSEPEAQEAVERLRASGVNAEPLRADVADEAEVERLIEQVVQQFGGLDVVINNAATTVFVPMSDLDGMLPADWDRLMAVNTKGPYLVARAAARHLRQGGGGAIVNVASVAGLRPVGSSLAYCVSKAALIHLTKCLAVALAPAIRVNAVAPGFMETRWHSATPAERYAEMAAGALLQRNVPVEDVAELVISLVENESLTGQTLVVDAGIVLH
jgi:3-oxoacyl-[acyl-carrier protein] reductase